MTRKEKLKRIEELQPIIEKKGKDINEGEGKTGRYDIWIDGHKIYKHKTGLKWATIKTLRTNLKKCVEKKKGFPEKAHPTDLTKWISKAEELRPAMSEFLNWRNDQDLIQSSENTRLEEIPKPHEIEEPSVGDDPLSDRTWSFYYYHASQEQHGTHAMLGKAILFTRKQQIAELRMVDGFYNSIILEGRFSRTNNDKIVEFNFRHKDSRTMNVLVSFSDRATVHKGTYNRFDGTNVMAGKVVLEDSDKLTKTNRQPELLSPYKHSEYSDHETIILNYLGIKNQSLITLTEFHKRNTHFIFSENWDEKVEDKFLEPSKSILYVAYVDSAPEVDHPNCKGETPSLYFDAHVEAFSELIRTLEEDLKKEGTISFSCSQREDGSDDRLNEGALPRNSFANDVLNRLQWFSGSLMNLRRIRFYIIFIPGPSRASACLVQLGWALAHCKHIMVIYRKGSLSYLLEVFLKSSEMDKKKFSIKLMEFENYNAAKIKKEIWIFINAHRSPSIV